MRRCGCAAVGASGCLGRSGAVAQPRAAPPEAEAVDTVSHNDAHRLEVAYTTLSATSGQVRDVFDARAVAEELPDLEENLHAIRHSVEETGQVVDIKQLQMCQLMQVNIQEPLGSAGRFSSGHWCSWQ